MRIARCRWRGGHGTHRDAVEDSYFGYGLCADGAKIASFAEGRISYCEWARRNGRLGDIHGLEDRYDHDAADELMA